MKVLLEEKVKHREKSKYELTNEFMDLQDKIQEMSEEEIPPAS